MPDNKYEKNDRYCKAVEEETWLETVSKSDEYYMGSVERCNVLFEKFEELFYYNGGSHA